MDEHTPNEASISNIPIEILHDICATTFREAPYGLFILSVRDQSVAFMNHIVIDLLRKCGVPPERLRVGVHPWEILDCCPAELSAMHEEARATGQVQHVQDFCFTANGLETYWDFTFVPYVDERSGEVTYTATIGIEITERKRTEKALRESEQRLRTIFERAGLGIVLVDLDGTIRDVNPAFARILGYSREELIGVTPRDITFPEDIGLESQECQSLVQGKCDIVRVEKRHIAKDGRVVWGELTLSLVRDESGDPDYYIALVEDIDERRRSEEERQRLTGKIEEQSRLLQTILDNAPVGIAVFDSKEIQIKWSNPAYKVFLEEDLQDADITGMRLHELVPGAELPGSSVDLARRVAETNQPYINLEYEHTGFARGITYWQIAVIPVRTGYDQETDLVTIVVEITNNVKARRLSDALTRINAAVSSTLDFDEIMRRVVVEAGEALRAQSTSVVMQEDGNWRVRYGHHVWAEAQEVLFTDSDVPHAGVVTEQRKPLAIEDFAADRIPVPEIVRRFNIRSALFIPLIVRGDVIGILTFTYDRTNAITEFEKDFGEKLSVALSLALENARLFQQLQQSREDYKLLVENQTDMIVRFDTEWRLLFVSPTYMDTFGKTHEELIGKTFMPLIHPDDVDRAREGMQKVFSPPYSIYLELRACTRYGWRWIGWTSRAVLDEEGSITSIVGVGRDITGRKEIEGALADARRRLEHQVHMLQRALLPDQPPDLGPQYRVATLYIPAYIGQEIGGDFYDVFRTEDGKLGILIGDVSGKGIEAAALASMMRSTVKAFAYDLSQPGEALTHANSLLCAHRPIYSDFVTVFLAIIDLDTGEIAYSSAGHPPAAIRRRTGEVEFLEFGQPPVGLLRDQVFEQFRCRIHVDDTFVLYTDGITEARRDHDMFEFSGLEGVLRRFGDLPPDDLIQAILSAVDEWSHHQLSDDIAVVVLERTTGE